MLFLLETLHAPKTEMDVAMIQWAAGTTLGTFVFRLLVKDVSETVNFVRGCFNAMKRGRNITPGDAL